MELGSYEISRKDANDICWNHMRSVVMASTCTLDRLLRIANNLYSGMEAMQVTAEITEAVWQIKARKDAEAALTKVVGLAVNTTVAELIDSRFRALTTAEPHRVARLVASVDAGRVLDTLNALLAYRTPGEIDADYRAAGLADPNYHGNAMEAEADERSADAEHYGY